MPDHKLQPGGRISRDPSPRPGTTTHSERQRDGNREENRRRESDTVKMRDKARHGEMETLERYYEKDRATAPRPREGEREWRERERRQDDRSKNGRPLSNLEESERHAERRMKKGDTFPRMRKGDADHSRRMIFTSEMAKERGDRRERERPQRSETDKWETERERTWQREKYREKERGDTRSVPSKESRNHRGRPVEDERSRQRDRYQESDVFQERRRKDVESLDIGEREAHRKRDQLRPSVSDREPRVPSPYGRRERDIYVDRRDREKAQRKGTKRDTRSEGDSDERELRRERVRDREREEFLYQQSKSEGDSRDKSGWDRDQERQEGRPRYDDREGDRSRRTGGEKGRYREGDRQAARPPDREGDRWRERDSKHDRVFSDRREDDRHRDRRDRERREQEADRRRRDDATGRSSRSPNESSTRVSPRAQSSGEWSSDMDSDTRYRRDGDAYEDRELKRDGRRHKEVQRDPERGAERGQRPQEGRRGGGSEQEHRRMWFDPHMGKNSKEEVADRDRRKDRRKEEERSVESQEEQERVKEESDERYLGQSHYTERRGERNEYRGGMERETEEVSVDEEQLGEIWRGGDKKGKEHLSDSDGGIEGSWRRDAEGENMTDNTEESDREEEGGSDYCARSESEGGSEAGCKQDRDRMLSGEDGFVTVSSGGDEDFERETDEDEFEDCQEFLEAGSTREDRSPVGSTGLEGDEQEEEWTMRGEEKVDEEEEEEEEEGREKKPKYVFCVIGQTLPRSGAERNDPESEVHPHCRDDMRQPEDDPHLMSGGNDGSPVTEREVKLAVEGPAEADIGHGASPDLRETATGHEMRSQAEHRPAEIGSLKRDSQTERLLKEWREKNRELGGGETSPLPNNPYAEVGSPLNLEQIQPLLDQLSSGAMSPEEVEAIRIRMSGAWSMSEEPKRHSQAPHLKWAKNVVREILGHSDEQIVDETNAEAGEAQGINRCRTQDEVARGSEEMPAFKVTADEQPSEPDLEEDELLEVEGLRGMRQSQTVMHADQCSAMHVVTPTYTHADTPLDAEGKEDRSADEQTARPGQVQSEEADVVGEMEEDQRNGVALTEADAKREKEVQMFLSVSNTLYKPNSCPILNYECEGDSQEEEEKEEEEEEEGGPYGSEDEQQGEELQERDAGEDAGRTAAGVAVEVARTEGEVAEGTKAGTLTSTCSFRDLGPEARLRRRGIRKTTERRRNGELVQVEEEEGVGRDRRTRIFSTTDDEDDRSKSWGEVDLRSVIETINRQKRNSRFFNAAQLYQQYNEEAQNFEILRQSRSDVVSVSEDPAASPAPSPPPARRPLPPLPPSQHSFSLSHGGSVVSAKSLPLPEPPKGGGRPHSPRLSISLTQSASLWRDLPAVRNSTELEDLTEDQRRLQEVRFEVVTSEASYCRSLDIVVEHFVKSKQLGTLLTTQDRNWLFSRLADVRAISHSFLSKLEERVESDMMHFAVCDIIARHCQRFKMVYVPYLTNQSYQDATYQRLMNENPGFRRIVEKLERSPVCQRLPLRSFLVLPFQRITRIKLLVQNIVKRTTPGTPEATNAIKALKLLEKLIQESNDSITQMKSIESLVSLNAKVDFECRTLPLISQSRRLVREGQVTELMDFSLKDTERSIYMHLFNDYLLLSLQKEGGRFTVIDHSPVSDLRAENCRVKLHSLQKNLFRLHMSKKALLLRTDTQSDKLRWISALSRPHPEIDFSAAQDFEQMQCIRAYVAQQPDELSLEKADVILVHQQSSDHWVEGTRLPDRHRGWIPKTHLETISNSRVKQRNLSDALKLTTATAAV